MIIKKFNQIVDFWIKELEQYDFIQLCLKPAPGSWSLGQVCMHLIESTNYYLEQIKICVSTNDHVFEEPSEEAKIMFQNNEFPDEIIVGPPSNSNTSQPDSKEHLKSRLINLKEEINNAGFLISKSPFYGKTKHPGLNYLNADEWFRFAEMHFRHHLRQKKRIDDFLKIN